MGLPYLCPPQPHGTCIADIFLDLASPCYRKANLLLGTIRAAGEKPS